MKKKIYIIPGFGETCNEPQYVKLTEKLAKKGLNVVAINPNWYKKLSEQTFRVETDAIVFGFSFGAVIAYLIGKKYPVEKLILASLSPIHTFTFGELTKDNIKHMSRHMAEELAYDTCSIKINLDDLTCNFVTLAGETESEEIPCEVIVKKTGHKLNDEYIKAICKNLK